MAARLLALAWLASSGHLDGPTYAPTSPNVLGCDDLCVGFRCATYSAQSCAVVLEDFGCACAGCACAETPPGNGSNATGPGDLAPSPACGPRLARDCGACGACFAHGPGRCEASGAMPAPGCAACPACAACFPASRCATARAAAAVAVAAPAWMLRPKHANCSDGDAKARHPEACGAYADARTCCEARAREGWCGGHFSDRGAYAGACRWTCGLCEAGRVDYAHLGRVLGPTEDVRRDIYARGRAKWVLANYPEPSPSQVDFETAMGKVMALFYGSVLLVSLCVAPCCLSRCRARYARRGRLAWVCPACGAGNGAPTRGAKCGACGAALPLAARPFCKPALILVVTIFGLVLGSVGAFLTGRETRATFPASKAPISVVFHSFRLIFGRAIISRNGLEAWVLFPKRERAEHSRRRDVESRLSCPGSSRSRTPRPRPTSSPSPRPRCRT